MKEPGHFMLLRTVLRFGEPGDLKTQQEVFDYLTGENSKTFLGHRQSFDALVYPGERLANINYEQHFSSVGIGWHNSDSDIKYSVTVTIQGRAEKLVRKVFKAEEAPKHLDSKSNLARTIAILSLSGKIAQVREQKEAIYGPIVKKKKKSSYSAL